MAKKYMFRFQSSERNSKVETMNMGKNMSVCNCKICNVYNYPNW